MAGENIVVANAVLFLRGVMPTSQSLFSLALSLALRYTKSTPEIITRGVKPLALAMGV